MNYFDEVKTAENFIKEFFDEAGYLLQSALMKDNKDEYIKTVLNLIEEYKVKINEI